MTNIKNKRQISFIGFIFAIISATLNTIFLFFAIIDRTGLLNELDSLFAMMLPSLFLAPAFLITIIILNYFIEKEKKIWTQLAIPFAIIYATLVSIVYFVVITVSIPKQINNDIENIKSLIFNFGSFLYAIDVLGYGFMSLATLFMSFAFTKKPVKIALFINGLLFFIIPMQMVFPFLLYVSAFQGISFPISMILVGSSIIKNDF